MDKQSLVFFSENKRFTSYQFFIACFIVLRGIELERELIEDEVVFLDIFYIEEKNRIIFI